MRIQLWSYNFAPEPQGIAPLSAALAKGLSQRGHEVTVVCAHPHYPDPIWGVRLKPYRERRDGIEVLRLPIWPGRGSALQRVRQELSYVAALSLAAPLLPTPDVVVAVTPSLPALGPAMAFAKLRRVPWVMWVMDIVTDGAKTTGEVTGGPLLRGAQQFELSTYESAAKVVVISDSFRANLAAKGVEPEKIVQFASPAGAQTDQPVDIGQALKTPSPTIVVMGNIGRTQGLADLVDAFQQNQDLERLGARLVIAGSGVAASEVAERITTDRVQMTGVLFDDDLERLLRQSCLAIISQRGDQDEFNLPSKLMHYFSFGLPTIASVGLTTETARIVSGSGGGWVTDARDPAQFAAKAAELLQAPEQLVAAGAKAREYAEQNFTPAGAAQKFEAVLESVLSRS